MNSARHLPEGCKTSGPTKSFPKVRRILALLFVAVVVLIFFITSLGWKFIDLKAALGILGLWTAFAPYKQPK